MAMDSCSISHLHPHDSSRLSAAKRPTLHTSRKHQRTDQRLDFVGVRNSQLLITLPTICISSIHAGMEDRPDKIAGSKCINAGGVQERTFSPGGLEKGDTIRSLAIFW